MTFPISHCCTVEVWERASNSIPHYRARNHLSMLGLKLIHISESDPSSQAIFKTSESWFRISLYAIQANHGNHYDTLVMFYFYGGYIYNYCNMTNAKHQYCSVDKVYIFPFKLGKSTRKKSLLTNQIVQQFALISAYLKLNLCLSRMNYFAHDF